MSYERKIFSQKAMELADEILRYEVEIERLADENERYEDMLVGNDRLREQNREMLELLKELPNNMMQSGSPFCPYCHQSIILPHDEDCNYTKVLAKAEEVG